MQTLGCLFHWVVFFLIPQRAFNALCHSTHLYGRRLVLEWAEAEESLEELRKKTAKHFPDGKNNIGWTLALMLP